MQGTVSWEWKNDRDKESRCKGGCIMPMTSAGSWILLYGKILEKDVIYMLQLYLAQESRGWGGWYFFASVSKRLWLRVLLIRWRCSFVGAFCLVHLGILAFHSLGVGVQGEVTGQSESLTYGSQSPEQWERTQVSWQCCHYHQLSPHSQNSWNFSINPYILYIYALWILPLN